MRILSFFLLLSTFLFSDLTDKGVNALAGGRNEEALEILEEAFSATKDPKALYYMGYLNMVEFQKYSVGMRQIRKAADMGYLEAIFEMGNIFYKSGKYETARKWLKRAAKKGHKKSIYLLGYMFEMGVGVKKSAASAKYWYKQIGVK